MEVKTKPDFYEALRRRLPAGTSIAVAKEMTATFTETIRDVLRGGGTILLPDIGRFEVKKTKARTLANRFTGEDVAVPASRRISFKPTTVLRKMVKGEAVAAEGSANE